jgi:hypothetical protein
MKPVGKPDAGNRPVRFDDKVVFDPFTVSRTRPCQLKRWWRTTLAIEWAVWRLDHTHAEQGFDTSTSRAVQPSPLP